MCMYEILAVLGLTQSVFYQIYIGMHLNFLRYLFKPCKEHLREIHNNKTAASKAMISVSTG